MDGVAQGGSYACPRGWMDIEYFEIKSHSSLGQLELKTSKSMHRTCVPDMKCPSCSQTQLCLVENYNISILGTLPKIHFPFCTLGFRA